ncbi:MAG: VanZ family protein [Deltaproteobacteria bacterium]|nr:VanZ family protein [Deltaproteobacteria bacterium]
MKPLKWIKFWLFLGWIFIGIVVFLSLDPSPPEMAGFTGLDKISHFVAYAFMMLWFGFCYLHGATYGHVGIGLIVMGVALEFLQGLMGYRSMEFLDMAVNTFGVVFGWFLAKTRLSSALIYLEKEMFHLQRH